jgi:Uncharacterized alpha/beta hydrolase domain (DUF2235)
LTLDGGPRVALLHPTWTLNTMRGAWEKWRTAGAARQAKAERTKALAAPADLLAMGRKPMPSPLDFEALAAGKEQLDDEAPNGSSSAFTAEWHNKRVLLAADAHTELLVKGLRHLASGGRYTLDLFKVSYHGSIGSACAPGRGPNAIQGGVMAKKIVVCCDGTANEFARDRTNVVKLSTHWSRIPLSRPLLSSRGRHDGGARLRHRTCGGRCYIIPLKLATS